MSLKTLNDLERRIVPGSLFDYVAKQKLKQQQMKWMADCLKKNKNPFKQWKKSLDISDEELAKFIEEKLK